MQCEFCEQKISQAEFIQHGLVCEKCEEGSFLARACNEGYQQWMKSLSPHFNNVIHRNMKNRISDLIIEIMSMYPDHELLQQAERLDQMILNEIQLVLSFYHKDDLIAATLSIKEVCRVSMINIHPDDDLWRIQAEYSMSILLQREIMSMDNQIFYGAPIEELDGGYHGFITAIAYARVLIMLRDNCEKYKFLKHTDNLMTMSFEFYEDETIEQYFDRYMKDGINEKPEDELEFEDMYLEKEIKSRGFSYKQIKDSIAEEIKKQLGINFNDLNRVFNKKEFFFGKSDSPLPIKILRRESLIKEGLDIEVINKSVALFSINNVSKQISNPLNSHYELRSIYETNDFIIFGEIDLIQNISIFEKLVVCGHFIEMYDEKASLSPAIRKAQTKLSSLFAYKLAETLRKNSFLVPTEIKEGREIVRAEIDCILDLNKKNILRKKDGLNLGDIDAIAIDPKCNQIIIYELKFFKPATSFREMVLSDKRRIVKDEIVRKMKNRQTAIEENINSVVTFIGGQTDITYTVKSVLVTIRSNFYLYEKDIGVETLTWNELIDSRICCD